MTELVSDLQSRLDRKAVASKRRWWEQYLKGDALFRGVAMDDVRKSVTGWVADYALLSLSDRDLIWLIASLVSKPHSEDKLAATLLLQEHAIPAGRLPWRQIRGGKVKIVAALTDPGSIRRYLEGVGLPARAPPMIAPARPHAQQEFDMEYSGSAA